MLVIFIPTPLELTKEEDILYINEELLFDYYNEEFDKKFTPMYREKKTQPMYHQFPSDDRADGDGCAKTAAVANKAAAQGSGALSPVDDNSVEGVANVQCSMVNVQWRGYDVQKIIDARYAAKLPCADDSNRHKESLKLATDLLLMLDGDKKAVQRIIEAQSWVQEIIAERDEDVAQTVESAASCVAEKEKKYASSLPSKPMLEAVKAATGKTYQEIVNSIAEGGNHNSSLLPLNSSLITLHYLYNPQMRSAYNFVPAIMGMLLMLICAMMTSISIVREKERGTMEVLLVSPVRPLMVIIAKAVPYLVLAFVILITILLMARFVLGVPLQGSLFWILAVSTLYILLALSLGLLISSVAQTQLVALLLSAMVLLMPVVMLSGMLFPVESMPTILQWISAIVPPRYYIEAMRKLMIMGVGIGDVAREVAVLSGMTIVLLSIALKKFNVRLE